MKTKLIKYSTIGFLPGSLLPQRYSIDIIPEMQKIILWHKQHATACKIVSKRQYSFLLTIMTLVINDQHTITIPIFFGITPIKQYKAIRRFLAWY